MEPVNSEPQSPAKVGSWASTVPFTHAGCRRLRFRRGLGLGTYQARHQLLAIIPHNLAIGPSLCAPADRGGKVERPPGGPVPRAAGGEGLSEAARKAPLTARLGLAPPSLLAAGELSGKWKNLCRRRQSCKRGSCQLAARSVPRAAATASAPRSLQGKGEGEEVTGVHAPTAASPGAMDGCLLGRGAPHSPPQGAPLSLPHQALWLQQAPFPPNARGRWALCQLTWAVILY